jgi:hypothetical protein
MFVVSGLSLLLLLYVAFGEGQRTFQQFHLEKLIAQGRVVQSAINNFLRPGLPLDQYVGFNTRAGTIMASDSAITAIVVFDQNGRAVFGVGDESIPLLSEAGETAFPGDSDAETRLSTDLFQAVLPLRNRYEAVGNLAVSMPRSIVAERVLSSFAPLIVLAVVLSAAFGIIGFRNYCFPGAAASSASANTVAADHLWAHLPDDGLLRHRDTSEPLFSRDAS